MAYPGIVADHVRSFVPIAQPFTDGVSQTYTHTRTPGSCPALSLLFTGTALLHRRICLNWVELV